jgi:uncharacterized repeat protein (TIGR03803 family)
MKTKFTSMKTQLTTLHNDSVVQTNMNTMKITNLMRMKLLCLATFAMAITAAHLTAQVFTPLHSFTGGSDGANPDAGLILSGNTLYGTTSVGGPSGYGTVFKVNTDRTGYTTLYRFTGANNQAYPETDLLLSGNTLYGASEGPGTTTGALFAINTNGTGFTTLHIFTELSGSSYTNSDGAWVYGALILSGNTLYGTAQCGGSGGSGTVFAVNTNGTGFTTMHSFTATSVPLDPYGNVNPPYFNSDGALPVGGLILSGNTLYGTTECGGNSGWGTVFAINTDGTGFTNLYSFTGGSDGAVPLGGLILSGNTLYGTANQGGSSGYGTEFAVNTDGTGFTILHSFSAPSGTSGVYQNGTNSDGVYPLDGLILSGNTLYGTTSGAGTNGNGTVFAVNTNGTGFTVLHTFTGANPSNSDGASPQARLILSGNTLYGTTYKGGSSGDGTVFSLSFPPPQLTLIPSGPYVNLTWPTNYAGFSYSGYTLQSTTNLVSPVWGTVSPGPVVVNGQNTVTNPISGTQMFFRLSSP